jgi:hypothetical protein
MMPAGNAVADPFAFERLRAVGGVRISVEPRLDDSVVISAMRHSWSWKVRNTPVMSWGFALL